MTNDEQFERAVGEWLAIGPTRLPADIEAIVRTEIHTTRQRRRAPQMWRLPMTQTSRIIAISLAALIVVMTVGFGLRYLSADDGSKPSGAPSSPAAPSIAAASPTRNLPSASVAPGAYPVVPAMTASPALHLAWQTGGPSSAAALSAPTMVSAEL